VPSPAVLLLALTASLAIGADDVNRIERLATCQDSWLEFKDDVVKSRAFAETFINSFTQKGNTGTFTPSSRLLVAGLPVVEARPETMGMGVGFSVLLDGGFEKAKAGVQKVVGRSLEDCDTSDGMRMCGHQFAPKKTVMVITGDDGKAPRTIVGCYYYYEK
jgi:hypothetical protein